MSKKINNLVESSVKHGPSELQRVGYLDGWRGLAILLVLVEHFTGLGSFIEAGRLGVDIFFVLSGYLMSRILFVKRVPITVFYKRRISRILPAFLLFVVTIYALDYLFTKTGEWENFIFTVFFIRTYIPAEPGIWGTAIPIGHLWSLNVEEHCYILLSAVALIKILKGREGIVLISCGIAAITVHIAYIKFPHVAPPSYALRTEVVASHLLLSAGYYLISPGFGRYIRPWMPVLALIIAALCYTKLFPWWSSVIISPFLLAFVVNHLSDTYKFVHSVLSINVIRLLGIWSYSIYLWQQPFFVYRSFFPFEIMALVPVIAVSLFSFYYIENPARAWINRNWR